MRDMLLPLLLLLLLLVVVIPQVCLAPAAVPLQQGDMHLACVQQEQLQPVHDSRGGE
jgi:hypothetical protein